MDSVKTSLVMTLFLAVVLVAGFVVMEKFSPSVESSKAEATPNTPASNIETKDPTEASLTPIDPPEAGKLQLATEALSRTIIAATDPLPSTNLMDQAARAVAVETRWAKQPETTGFKVLRSALTFDQELYLKD